MIRLGCRKALNPMVVGKAPAAQRPARIDNDWRIAVYGPVRDGDKLPGLQVALAISALSIVYFHSWAALDRFPKGTSFQLPILTNYGWLGVDLFFALTGFVIGLVITKPGFNPRDFLIGRAARLYPLWLVTLTLFALLSIAWRGPTETETLGYFLHSASLIETKQFPYYDIGWSLQHEVVFYALAALIVPLFGVIGLLLLIAASSATYGIETPWYIANLAQYHAEFLAGLVACLCRRHLLRLGAVAPLMIGSALVIAFYRIYGGRPFLPVALFFLVIGFANMASSAATRPLEILGDASYSIYLLHPLVFIAAKSATHIVSFPLWMQEPIRYGCIVVTLALSLLSWRYFEAPIIRAVRSLARKRELTADSTAGLAAR